MKIENYKIKDWEEIETGIFLNENEDWILIKYIPVDFQIDGYKLINKKFIAKRELNADAANLERVFKLRKDSIEKPTSFEFMKPISFFKWLEMKYGCFEFQEEDEDELFYGVLKETHTNSFYIDMVKSDGTIDSDFDVEFFKEDIRAITFESDYFNAISLLFKDTNR